MFILITKDPAGDIIRKFSIRKEMVGGSMIFSSSFTTDESDRDLQLILENSFYKIQTDSFSPDPEGAVNDD